MKRFDKTRSHSWLWESHISPKNSKWLQENLSDMDTKVASMLKIIEEDADSFAQRAEMYYRKRPELVSLVEDFYRSYRALAERYSHLTKEIRMTMSPAFLQQQPATTQIPEQQSPSLPDSSLDNNTDPDMASPSFSSYTVDCDDEDDCDDDEEDLDGSPSDHAHASPSPRVHTDEDELSPLSTFPVKKNNHRHVQPRSFSMTPKFHSFRDDDDLRSSSRSTASRSSSVSGADSIDTAQLQRDLKHYQEENKALITDVAKLKSLQIEFSNAQNRLRSLETEDRANKRKLKTVQEQSQKLEVENAKLNDALIALKEEKTEASERCVKQVEQACQRSKELEDEIAALKIELSGIQSLKEEHLQKMQEAEASKQKLQESLASLQEESQQELQVTKETFERQIRELQQKILTLEDENQSLRNQIETKEATVSRLEDELNKVINYRNDLEQLFIDSEKEKNFYQQEKSMAEASIQRLNEELTVAQKEKERQADKSNAEIERLERVIQKLEADMTEAMGAKEILAMQCQQYREKCEAMEAAEVKLKEQLGSISSENSQLKDEGSRLQAMANKEIQELQNQLSSLSNERSRWQAMANKADLEIQELQSKLSSLSAEKEATRKAMEEAYEQARQNEEKSRKEIKKLQQELLTQARRLETLEDDLLQKETSASQKISKLEKDKCQTKASLESAMAVSESLRLELSSLQSERTKLTLAIQEAEQNHATLQQKNSELMASCARSEEKHRDVAEELAILLLAQKSLQHEDSVKADAIQKLKGEVLSLEEQLEGSMKEKDSLAKQKEESDRQFEAHIADLKLKLSDVVTAHATLVDQIAEKERSIGMLNQEMLGLQKQHAAEISSRELGLQDHIKSFTEQVAEKERNLEMLNQLILGLQKQHAAEISSRELDLQDQIKSFTEQVAEKERNIEMLNQEILGLQKQHAAEISSSQTRELGLQDQLKILTEQVAEKERNLEMLNEDILDLQKRHAAEISSSQAREIGLQDHHKSLTEQVAEKERNIEMLNQEILGLQKQHATETSSSQARELSLQDQIKSLLEQVAEKETNIEMLNQDILGLQKQHATEISSSQTRELGLHDQIKSFTEQAVSLRSELEECLARKNGLEKTVEELHQANIAEKEANEALLQKQQAFMNEIVQIQKINEELELKCNSLEEGRLLLIAETAAHVQKQHDMKEMMDGLELNGGAMQVENMSLKEQLVKLEQEKKTSEEQSERQIHGLHAENTNLVAEAQSKATEIGVLQSEITLLQSKNVTLDQNLAHLQEEISVLKRREESLSMDLQKSSAEAQSLMSEMERLNEALARAESENVLHVQEQQKCLQENASLKEMVEESQKRANRLTEEIAVLTRNVNELESQVRMLEGQKGAIEKDLVIALQTGDSLKHELLAIGDEKQQLVDRLAEVDNKLKAAVIELQTHKEDAEKAIAVSNEKIERQRESYDLLKQELSLTVAAKGEIEQLFAALQHEKGTLSERLGSVQKEFSNVQQERDHLLSNVEAVNSQLNEKVREIDQLQKQLKTVETVRLHMEEQHRKISDKWSSRVNRLEKEMEDLKSDHHQSRNEISVHEQRAIELNNAISSLHGEREFLQKEKTASMKEVANLQKELESLKLQVSQKDEAVQKLSVDAEALQKSLSLTEEECENLKELLQKDKDCHGEAINAMKNENSSLQKELESRNGIINELQDEVSNSERKLSLVMGELTVKEELVFKLQQDLMSLTEENKDAALKLDSALTEIAKLKEELTDLRVVQMQELHDRFILLQDESKSVTASHQEKVAENILLRGQIEEHITAASRADEENSMLKAKLTEKDAELGNLTETMQRRKQEHEELAKSSELKAMELQILLQRLEEEHKDLKSQIQTRQEEYQSECSKHNASVAELDSLRKALDVSNGENKVLKERVSLEETSVAKLKEEVSMLYRSKAGLAEELESLNRQSKVLKSSLDRARKALSQMMSEMEQIDGLLSDGASTPVKHGNISEERTVEIMKGRVFHIEDVKAAKEFKGDDEEEITIQQFLRSDGPLDRIADSESDIDDIGLERLINFMVESLGKLKEKIIFFTDDNHLIRKKLLEATIEQSVLENCMKDLQSRCLELQSENTNLVSEMSSFRREIRYLGETAENHDVTEVSAATSVEIQKVEKLLHSMHDKAVNAEEENNRVKKELDTVTKESQNLQVILYDLQGKGRKFALLLKDNLLAACEETKLAAEILDGGSYGTAKLHEWIEKLDELVKQVTDNNDEGSNEAALQDGGPEQEAAMALVTAQLQERVEEASVLCGAVKTLRMALHHHTQEQCVAPQLHFSNADREMKAENRELDGPRLIHAESTGGAPGTPEKASAKNHQEHLMTAAKELMQEECQVLERKSADGENEAKLIQDFARLHINLGMRLHQALMDEQLEQELVELKEERSKLKAYLQTQVELVQKMEAELGALQKLLKEGNMRQKAMDARQKHQWVEKRKRAEARVDKLTEELVSKREQVSKMQEEVMSWAEEQEIVTGNIEEQVINLVSKESEQTMEGWNDEQAKELMEQMKSYKALTRRRSLEIEVVEKEMRRVSTSIEVTQRQLLVTTEEEDDENDDEEEDYDDDKEGKQDSMARIVPANGTSNSFNKDHGIRGLGMSWFMLLFKSGSSGRSRLPVAEKTSVVVVPERKNKLRCWNCVICSNRMKSSDVDTM